MEQEYCVRKIGERTWAIEEGVVRMFLIEGEARALLLDTGFGKGALRELVSGLTQKPLMLALSHSDRDHIGGCAQFEGELWLHPAEYERFLQNMPQNRLSLKPLWEGDIIDLGGRVLTVLHTPGHTPGSIMLLEQETGVLFSGDSVQEGPIYMFGSGRNLEALCASMERLAKSKERFQAVLPCHGKMPLDASYIGEIRKGADAFCPCGKFLRERLAAMLKSSEMRRLRQGALQFLKRKILL